MYLEDSSLDVSDKKQELIVKTNRLITAIENLSLAETRLIQLAIIGAREKDGLNNNERLSVTLESYAKTFNTTEKNAYMIMREADDSLRKRTFYFLEDGDKGISNWVQESIYKTEKRSLDILFTSRVISEITNIDGYKTFFTSYRLAQTSDFSSIYSLRLFELLMTWAKLGKTPVLEIEAFRSQLGIEPHEYQKMGNFKARVLDIAIKEINKHTDYEIDYNQSTKGRKIIGFSFIIKSKKVKYKRILLSYSEAVELGSKQPEARPTDDAYLSVGHVLGIKDEAGNQKYRVDDSNESKQEYYQREKEKADKRAKAAQAHKWVTIGNTRIDDEFIDAHILPGESRKDARERLIKEVQKQIEMNLDNDDIPEHVRFANKSLNRADAEKLAKMGEDWDSLKARLIGEGYTLKF